MAEEFINKNPGLVGGIILFLSIAVQTFFISRGEARKRKEGLDSIGRENETILANMKKRVQIFKGGPPNKTN